MAARNVKHLPGFDPSDKMQSSTLKRQPSPDWSKNDLLRLLSYFEGELQARDIAIAALKAEKAKQLLYQAKYGRFGLGDPFVALQRDAIGQRDSNFDEAAVKSMYDNQLAQLENLIATQRKAQLKMREQLASAEKRYHKVCSELEEEKRKHAQDTAQGDDVTYMLEKERERLRQEIDFEKSNSKKLEKDLRRTLAALEEERASAARHKQVALLLLKERKHLIQKLNSQGQRHSQGEGTLSEDQLQGEDLAGLEADSGRSLGVEAALEQQLGEFEAERTSLRAGLSQEQARTRELEAQVEALQRQVQSMATRTSLDSIEIKSSVSPQLQAAQPTPPVSSYSSYSASPPSSVSSGYGSSIYGSSPSQSSLRPAASYGVSPPGTSPVSRSVAVMGSSTSAPMLRQVPKVNKVFEGGRIGSSSPEREVVNRLTDSPVRKVQYGVGSGGYPSSGMEKPGTSALSSSPRGEARVVTMGSSGPDSTVHVGGSSPGGARVSISPGNSATVVTQGGGKISFHVSPGAGGGSVVTGGGAGGGGGGVGSPRRTATAVATVSSAGRGAPPPIPPNKPNIVPVTPGAAAKPAPPPKVSVMGRSPLESQGGLGNKTVQIPVNVVSSPSSSTSSSPSTSSQSSRESSPIRKTAQPSHPPGLDQDVPAVVSPNSAPAQPPSPTNSLEFLGPEMANLQELLASLSTGEASARDPSGVTAPTTTTSTPSTTTITSTTTTPSSASSSSTSSSSSSSSSSFATVPPSPTMSPRPPSTSPLPSPREIQNSAVHRLAALGDFAGLQTLICNHGADVNLPMKDGTTPVHCAVENDREACLRLLLDSRANASALRDDRVTPLHIAAAEGRLQCLQLLLERGAAVNVLTQAGDTPLHLAVCRGDTQVCLLLLRHGAKVALPGPDGLTSFHYTVLIDRPDILSMLLDHLTADIDRSPLSACDEEGRTLAHMAAVLDKETCLSLLLQHVSLDLAARDVHGLSALDVATPSCRDLLLRTGKQDGRCLHLLIELKTQLEGTTVSCIRIGSIEITPSSTWQNLEERMRSSLTEFLSLLDRGLRTRRIARMDMDSSGENGNGFTLGITMSHIKFFEMGFYRWSPGMQMEKLPYGIASNSEDKKVAIIVDDNLCELIAFDILHPVAALQDYLRLLSEYKSVVFHGPVNSGKSYLTHRLAQCLAHSEKAEGRKPVVYQKTLTAKSTLDELLAFFKQKGCLLRVDQQPAVSPIVLLEDLENVNMATIFGPLLDQLPYRGSQNAFSLKDDADQQYYFPEHFYILATLNRTRFTGIDLNVQQLFRWVQFRHDMEPLRNLLARHFLRRLCHLGDGKLPPPDDPLIRATEWVICIWQRLNDSLGKLGLPDVAVGPCCFFKCPVEKRNPQLILQWVRELWNSVIANQVREAVKKGTGTESQSQGQQKVSNTALYVLMQRSIVLGCPLTGAEKETYLKGFSGSNELDLPFKTDKRESRSAVMQLAGQRAKSAQYSTMSAEREESSSPVSSVFTSPVVQSGSTNNGSPSGSSASKGRPKASFRVPGGPCGPCLQHGPQEPSGLWETKASLDQQEERGRSLELFTGTNIKRRSLSESSVNKTAQQLDELERLETEQRLTQGQSGQGQVTDLGAGVAHQAKVPKLEVRSSRILSLSNSFKTSPGSGGSVSGGSGDGRMGRVSPLQMPGRLFSGNNHHHHHHHHHSHHKKSRSSENISPSGLYAGSKLNSANPFSFSLSTPKSTLTSFKFLDKSSPTLSTFSSSPSSSSSSTETSSSVAVVPSPIIRKDGTSFLMISEGATATTDIPQTQPSGSPLSEVALNRTVVTAETVSVNGGVKKSSEGNGVVQKGQTTSISES